MLLDEVLQSFEQMTCDCAQEDDCDALETFDEELLAAVMSNDVDAAVEALDCGADVDATDEDGMCDTPLSVIVYHVIASCMESYALCTSASLFCDL
jgi:hypothetical protein